MTKLSIAEVKRQLSVGKEFTAEFVGTNRRVAGNGMSICRRRVIQQGTQMVCLLLDGPKQGERIYLGWKGVSANEVDGSIVLADEGEAFLRITLEGTAGELQCASATGSGSCEPATD